MVLAYNYCLHSNDLPYDMESTMNFRVTFQFLDPVKKKGWTVYEIESKDNYSLLKMISKSIRPNIHALGWDIQEITIELM